MCRCVSSRFSVHVKCTTCLLDHAVHVDRCTYKVVRTDWVMLAHVGGKTVSIVTLLTTLETHWKEARQAHKLHTFQCRRVVGPHSNVHDNVSCLRRWTDPKTETAQKTVQEGSFCYVGGPVITSPVRKTDIQTHSRKVLQLRQIPGLRVMSDGDMTPEKNLLSM